MLTNDFQNHEPVMDVRWFICLAWHTQHIIWEIHLSSLSGTPILIT